MPKTIRKWTFLSALLVALQCICSARAEELPPVPISVFYSKAEAHWKDSEKIIDAVIREFPRLALTKVSIDDDKGYAQLVEEEQNHKGMKPGDLTLIFGPFVLTSKGERRDVEMYFGSMARRLLNPKEGKGRLKSDAAALAEEIFGKGAKIEALPDVGAKDGVLDANYYRVLSAGKKAGWIADAYWPIGCPICNDTQFLAAFATPDLKVLDVRPVRELERYGLPLEAKETAGFTRQFKGLSEKQNAANVDIVSGATKTSISYESAINRVLEELKKRDPQ